MLKKFSVFDLILIALIASLGIATKPFVYLLANILTGPLLIPTGVVAGCFYMLWLVLAAIIVRKRGTAFLTGLVQGIMVLVVGMIGTHGIISLISYTVPGLVMEIGLLIKPKYIDDCPTAFYGGLLANCAGTLVSNFVFFRLPLIPLILILIISGITGGLGGILAYKLVHIIEKYRKEKIYEIK